MKRTLTCWKRRWFGNFGCSLGFSFSLLMLGLSFSLLVLLWPAEGRTGGFTMTSFGGRRCGMMANVGDADDLSAVVHNPAALADQHGLRLYLFVSPAFVTNSFYLKGLDPKRFPEINPPDCGKEGHDPCPWPVDKEGYYTRSIQPERYFGVLPFAGISTDLAFLHPSLRDVAVALAVYTPNFYGAFLPEEAPSSYSIIGGMFLVLATNFAVSWRINKYIALGARVSVNYMNLTMSQKLSPANSLSPPGEEPTFVALVAQSMLGDLRMDYNGTDVGAGWGGALLISPLPWMKIGIGYEGATPPRFQGDVHFKALGADPDKPNALQDLLKLAGYKLPHSLIVELPIPHSLQVGVAFRVAWWMEIGLDARFWFYNFYKRQTIKPIYDPKAPGKEPLTEENLSKDKNYHLSYQLNAGLLFRPWATFQQLEVMFGFGYDHSPIPNETFSLDNPSMSQLKFSTGLRWQINRRWRLSLAYFLVYYLGRDIQNSQNNPPTNMRISGMSHSPAIDLTVRF